MAKRKKRKVNSTSIADVVGRLSTQPVIVSISENSNTSKQKNKSGSSAGRLGVRSVSPITDTGTGKKSSPRPSITAVFSKTNSRGTPNLSLQKIFTKPPLSFTAAIQRLPINLVNKFPLFKFQVPLLSGKPLDKFSEDVLDVSETNIVNSRFEIVEKNGISSFRPEILQITDFLPIWKTRPETRANIELSPAGKLFDAQYNSMWLRRDTLIATLDGMSKTNEKETIGVLNDMKKIWISEIQRTERTIKWFSDFVDKVEVIKDLLNIKNIKRSSFGEGFLPLDDFFDRRMQYTKEKFSIFTDTKIILQLLADFKQITENYSTSLLDLTDPDRSDDYDPVAIDTTYTLNNGFGFTIEQIRSQNEPINSSDEDFFNTFLNSLPNEPDGRIKLLITLLSKELRISKNLGIPKVQKALSENFNTDFNGSPFDNIIGIPGSNIFEQPLGNLSLSSLFVRPIGDNAIVLPLEKKYVDAKDIKKTFIPGSSFLVETILETQELNFNTKPYFDFSDELSNKINNVNSIIRTLYDAGSKTTINPENLTNLLFSSFKSSIDGIQDSTRINKDQAIVSAVFKLSASDNILKNKLFQFCLLVGLASNSKNNVQPIFGQLANEIGTIHNFSAVSAPENTNPNLSDGLRALRPFLEQLALDIENRVMSLTTPAPKINTDLALKSNPDYSKFSSSRSSKFGSVSPFLKLSPVLLKSDQVTINIPKLSIKNILMSNADPKSANSTNLIKEFVDLSNGITKVASSNGQATYLLDDQSGRTRFNFLSTSTQLLLVFEMISSMAVKYSFAEFGRSRTVFNAFITIDTLKNNFTTRTIEEITSIKSSTISSGRLSSGPAASGVAKPQFAINSKIKTSAFTRMLNPTNKSISKSGNSLLGGDKTKFVASTLSLAGKADGIFVRNNIGSAFLGNRLLNKVGIIKISEMDFTRDTVNIRSSLRAIKNKTIVEDKIIGNILNILSVIEKRIRNGKSKISNFFSSKILKEFLIENSTKELEIIKNPSQVRVSAFIQREASNRYREFSTETTENSTSGYLVDPMVVFPETRNALYSLLSEPQYLIGENADLRTKIISIGIPAGFSQQLTGRVEHAEISKESFKSKQFDVVAIKVYKRDQRFEEIIFKPKTFLFDLSLFQEEILKTQARKGENFSRIVGRNRILDLETIDLSSPTYRNVDNIINDEKYSFLSTKQKTELIKNHTVSALNKLYLRMLTGMNVGEDAFLANSVPVTSNLNEKLVNLVYSYLRNTLNKNIPNQPIKQLLINPDIDDESKDILRLITYGNLVFDPETYRNKITSPKMFDRIFHISFNTEDFEVDKPATMETETGRAALEKISLQERLIDKKGGKTIFVSKTRNELVFEDYFVVVENSI